MVKFEEIEFDFEKISDYAVEVTQADYKSIENISDMLLIVKDCLNNARMLAECLKSKDIVEGILITYHSNGDVQCVGHAWNIIDGEHIDFSYLLKVWEEVERVEYYAFRQYPVSEKNIEIRVKEEYDFYEMKLVKKTQVWLHFKTNIQKKAHEYRDFLIGKGNDSQD